MRKLTGSLCLTLLLFLGSAGESFALPACPSSGFFHECSGTWTYDGGEKYVGEWRNDKPHGQGTHSGDKYVGEVRDGKRHGQGTLTYADGRVEEGVWENDNFLYAK
jgi:hypothetical protein